MSEDGVRERCPFCNWTGLSLQEHARQVHARALRRPNDEQDRVNRSRVEIARLAKDSLAAVTGGDSFAYLEPLRKGSKVRYFVRQEGEQPTYDVVVRVEEVTRLEPDKEKRRLLFGPVEVARTLKRGSGFDWTYPDPTPSDPREWPLVFLEPPRQGASAREFRIELAARNGIVVQWLRVVPLGDRWQTTSKDVDAQAGVPSRYIRSSKKLKSSLPSRPRMYLKWIHENGGGANYHGSTR